MWKNNLKIAFRSFTKHKAFSVINLLGLSFGLACFLFIGMYILDELSYDDHFAKAERIVRIEEDGKFGPQAYQSSLSPDALADAVIADFPEVESATRLATHWDMWVRYNQLQELEKLLYVDSNFFQVFGIDFLHGNASSALSMPHAVVLSQNAANRYFGDKNPIGETMDIGDRDHLVTGVMEDLPVNTHFHTDFFISLPSLRQAKSFTWSQSNYYTYALLGDAGDFEIFAEKLNKRKKEYYEPSIQEYMSQSYDEFYADGNYVNLYPVPITDIHLYGHKEDELAQNGDIRYIYLFSIVAFLILLLACINFINLSTARAADRSKEVGVRKVIGARRINLIQQFLSESLMVCLSAFLIALVLCQLLLPYFNTISNKNLDFAFLFQPTHLLLMLGVIGGVSILSGLYPAFFLSGFRPIKAIRKEQHAKGFHASFRKVSVVFQFTITAILLVSAIVITQQLHFIQNKKLGYNPEQVFIMQSAWEARQNYGVMKEAVRALPQVVSVSGTTDLPAQEGGNRSSFTSQAESDSREVVLNRWWVDYEFFNTLEIDISEGRAFDEAFGTDTSAVVLNETAVKRFGLEPPYINQTISQQNGNVTDNYTVVGIVDDFHFKSLHNEIEPLGIFLTRNPTPANLTMRIRTSDIEGFINATEKIFKQYIPNSVFTYSFFDERFDKMYAQEYSIARLFNAFTGLAVFIACIGLFGLISYIVQQRTKEIGIRKVLGASVDQIVILLAKDYLKLVIIALLVAIPIAWYGANQWLNNFAYRIDVQWWVFLLAGGFAIGIAFLTVCWQSIKAALANPISSLRNE